MEKEVYLIVDESGKTLNVFATIGMAIDCIGLCAKRIEPSFITFRDLTCVQWNGRNGQEHSCKIEKCPICTDVNMDYMNRPRNLVI